MCIIFLKILFLLSSSSDKLEKRVSERGEAGEKVRLRL